MKWREVEVAAICETNLRKHEPLLLSYPVGSPLVYDWIQ